MDTLLNGINTLATQIQPMKNRYSDYDQFSQLNRTHKKKKRRIQSHFEQLLLMISVYNLVIHKSRKSTRIFRLNCVIVELDGAHIFVRCCSCATACMEKTWNWNGSHRNGIRVSHACKKKKIQTKRYPLKFNLHKEQFVSHCFIRCLCRAWCTYSVFLFNFQNDSNQLLIMSLFYIPFETK